MIISRSRPKKIILDEFVRLGWSNQIKSYYERLGYEFTSPGDKFKVRVGDLTFGSQVKVSIECPLCGIVRSVKYNGISKKNHTYCHKCSQIEDIFGEGFGRLVVIKFLYSSEHAHWLCQCSCGNKTIISSSAWKKETVSCGCYNKDRIGDIGRKQVGENHPQWKEELTNDKREISRKYKAYHDWVNLVFDRDLYTCIICKKHGGNLNAHHLYSYSDYPKYRLEIDNGVTLCSSCHLEFHMWMGNNRIPCTPNDFLKFIEGEKDMSIKNFAEQSNCNFIDTSINVQEK